MVRHRSALFFHDGEAGLLHIPLELDAGCLQHATRGFAHLGADAVAWDQRHPMDGQNNFMLAALGCVSLVLWRRLDSTAALSKHGHRVQPHKRTISSGLSTRAPKTVASSSASLPRSTRIAITRWCRSVATGSVRARSASFIKASGAAFPT